MRWTENWLRCDQQDEAELEAVTGGAPQESMLESVGFDIFINDWGEGESTPLAQPVDCTTMEGCLIDWMDVVVLSRTLTGCRNVGMGTS